MDELVGCVSLLYDGSSSAAQKSHANQWLIMFQQRPEALELCLDLLSNIVCSTPSPALLFFAVNTILISIRRENKKSNPSEIPANLDLEKVRKEEILIKLAYEYINKYPGADYQTFHFKFAQAIAAQWIRTELDFSQYMERLFTFTTQDSQQNISTASPGKPNNAAKLQILLSVLELIPEEIDRSTLSVTVRDTLNTILRKQKTIVLDLCFASLQNAAFLVRVRAILCLQSWNHWLVGSRLILQHPVYESIWGCLFIPELFPYACTMLIDFLSRPFGSLSLTAGSRVFSLMDIYKRAIEEQDSETCLKITWLITAFSNDNAHNIAREREYCEKFSSFVLEILAHPAHKISSHCLSFFEKLALFINSGEREIPENLFVNATAQILRHFHEKPEEISESSRQNIIVFPFLTDEQWENQSDFYSEELEVYLDYYKQACGTLRSILKLLGERFYKVFFDAISEDSLWLDVALIACIASSDGQKEEISSPLLLQLFQIVLRGATALSSGMIFIATHSRWLKTSPELIHSVFQYVASFPHASPLNELASFAKAFALTNLVKFHRYALATNVALISDLVKHLQAKIGFIKGIHKVKWVESTVGLIVALEREISNLLVESLNRPWNEIIEREDIDEICIELEMIRKVFDVLESADARHQQEIRKISAEFLASFLHVWSHRILNGEIEVAVFTLVCKVIDGVMFCAQESLFSMLESLIQFLGNAFTRCHLPCFLHSFSTCFRIYLNENTEESFCQLLLSLSESVMGFLVQGGISNQLEIVKEFFLVLGQAAQNPRVLDKYFSKPERLDVLLNLSVATLPFNEASSIKVIFQFLDHLLTRITDLSQIPRCQELYQAILRCIGTMFNQTTIQRSAALILFTFEEKIPKEILQMWTANIVTEWKSSGVRLSDEDATRIVKLLCTLNSKNRFRSMIIDLSKIVSGEMTPDVLLAYEF